MSLEDTELKIGEVKLRGVWIAISLSILTTMGGGVWATAEFYNRITAMEQTIASTPNTNKKLTELGVNLKTIMENQKELFDMRDRIAAVEKASGESVIIVNQFKNEISKLNEINQDINDLWKGLDAVSNPLN